MIRGGIVCATILAAALPAAATQRFGAVQLSGNLQTQNLVRTPDASTYQFIQQRNTARLRLQYDWLDHGRFLSSYDVPFIERSQVLVQWRGVYDSVYDTTPGFAPREDIHGRAYSGRRLPGALRAAGFSDRQLTLDGLTRGERDAFRFDDELREAWIEVRLRGLPLTVRAGKQQLVWGESDNFRLLDRVNPLDLTWHLQQEIPPPAFGWDELRQPLWMIHFLYDLDQIGPLSQAFLEWYWNPGDWQPAKQAYLPRPWGLPFLNPLTNPLDGAMVSGFCDGAPTKIHGGPNDGSGKCTSLIGGTKLFGQGDWSRNPAENSQVGVRLHAVTPASVELALVYFYQRWAGDDGTNSAPLAGVPRTFNPQRDLELTRGYLARGIFPAKAISPYVHTIGLSANYAEETWTQTVYRLETVYDMGIPFFDVSRVTLIDVPALPGVTKKDMWKGMIGFDRPTWIRPLNRVSTFLVTGQFFWHHLLDNPSCRAQDIAILPAQQRRRAGSCLVGGLDLPSRERPPNVAFRDKIRGWEALASLAVTGFFRGGSVVPTLGLVVDPVNQFGMEPFWSVDWFVRNDLVVNLAQRYFVTPRGHSTPIFETWGLAGFNAGRSETSLRMTLQF
ncbi:MAG TPA: DUF1302 family protein [Candidatus Eisenbacteria bacterium]|nr:DUF1302 family protein [Candidatus Eisenbacteria bacterium]